MVATYVYMYLLNLSWCSSNHMYFFFFSSASPFPSVYYHMLKTSVNYSGNLLCDECMYLPYTCKVSVNYHNLQINSCGHDGSCPQIIASGCTANTVVDATLMQILSKLSPT